MRQRGNDSWQLRVHAGRDPNTGRKRYVERTFRGTKRGASKALASMVAEVDQRPVGILTKGTVAALCNEWLAHATPSFSPKTVETTRMYIDDPIIPVLGAIQVAKLTPTDPDRFYRQLLEVGRSRGPYAPATIRRPRHHSTGIDPRGSLGMDHTQSGHRRLSASSAHEGTKATRSW
jgi:hypothetical protein